MEQAHRVIVVASDDRLTKALKASLRLEPSIRVTGPCADADGVAQQVGLRTSSVAVVDLDADEPQGMDSVTLIRDGVAIPVLIAGTAARSDLLARALAAGACGVLPPVEDASAILRAVRRAEGGELVLPDGDLSALVDRLQTPAGRLDVLTRRERQTLHLLAEGLSTADVALHLGISTATVQTHVKNLLSKLGLHSKVQAVRVALLAGA